MDVADLLSRATDTVTVSRVFGEPVERGGVTVVPVARVWGGAGGGGGTEPGDGPAGGASGSGGGVGLRAAPAGVFVISNGEVAWRPAVDVNRIVLGGQLVAVAALLTLRAALRRRAPR